MARYIDKEAAVIYTKYMPNGTEVTQIPLWTSRYRAVELIEQLGAIPVRITASHPRFALATNSAAACRVSILTERC